MTGPSPRIWLAGLSGAGKTTVAGWIARWTGWTPLDVDGEVEREAGEPIAALWARQGEAGFRAAERAAVERLTAGEEGPAVMALGGGALEDPESRSRLERWGTGIWLDAPVQVLAARVEGAAGERPLLAGREVAAPLRELAERRGARFAALGYRVDTAGLPVEAVAVEVLRRLTWPDPEPIAPGVAIGPGALTAAGALVEEAAPEAPAGPMVVATDARVWRLHGRALVGGLAAGGREACPAELPPGEAAKTVSGLSRLWSALAAGGADRDTPVAALGGGAVGDVAGLAAATYKRGVPLALFPTTILAQVDAAIGGKNAIDFGGVKNLVGTFHFPRIVAIDTLCPLTLPDRDWRAGWAEVVKSGLIGDPELFDLCARESGSIAARRLDVVAEAIRRAVAVKVAVVATDPRESGRRRELNLGHTMGHAIESAADGALLHGEAIAMGLVAAARLAEDLDLATAGLAERVAGVLEGLGLPTRPPGGLDPEGLLARIRHDKKRRGGAVHAVLPLAPGRIEVRALDDGALARWAAATTAGAEVGR